MRLAIFCFVYLVSSIFAPIGALAHGDSPSFELEVGPLLIDVGYDKIGIRPGEEVAFDFDLYRTRESPSFEPFDLVRVEVRNGMDIVYSEEIQNRQDMIPTTKITFPESGQYTLGVGYVREGSLIAEAEFDVPVGETNGWAGRLSEMATYIAAAAIATFAVFYAVYSYRNRRASS